MSITRSLLTLSLAASLAGCFGRYRRYDTVARDTRSCSPSQHWERGRCVNNDHGHDDRAHHPLIDVEERKNLRGDLHEQPCGRGVERRSAGESNRILHQRASVPISLSAPLGRRRPE